MAGKNNAAIYDPSALVSAGIDPKTGLPLKMMSACDGVLKENIRKQLRIMDEQNAINRYTWTGLPKGLSGQLIERILYYRGQGILFQLHGTFYFLPYALDGEIDVYGRFMSVTPLPFTGSQKVDGKKETPWIQGLSFKPRYEVADLEELLKEHKDTPDGIFDEIDKTCVILRDYTEQMSQTNIPRQLLQDPLLDVMSDCIPFMRTALLNSTGVMGMKVSNEDESSSVYEASNALNRAALEGRKYVPIVGTVDFQELAGGNVAKAEEFMMALQSLDNYRLSLYGLDNGGLFQKHSHMLQAEQEMNAGNTGLVAEDGLRNRQMFATICNSWFGTMMWCEPSECTLGIDRDGDMVAGDDGEAATEQKMAAQEEPAE